MHENELHTLYMYMYMYMLKYLENWNICDPILENLTYHTKCSFELFIIFRLVTAVLAILSFVDNHKEQSESFEL